MATKPLPRGTVNLSVNLAKEFRDQIGQHCFKLDRSIGDWARELFSRGLTAAKSLMCLREQAHIAETADLEAIRLHDEIFADDKYDPATEAHKAKALRENIVRSATADQAIGQLSRA